MKQGLVIALESFDIFYDSNKLKISLITVCYNSASTIRDTIASVEAQTHGNIEHIVVDGGSTDGTIDVLRLASSLTKCVSERDCGIYDAMNKGIAMASGDVIGFINSDDLYADTDVLDLVASTLTNSDVEVCYGDLVYVAPKNPKRIVRYWKSSPYSEGCFARGWIPPHPTFFAKKSVYDRFGVFNLSYRRAADVELMIRFLTSGRVKAVYIPKILVRMRIGGASNSSFIGIFQQNREILRALKSHSLRVNWLFFLANKIVMRGKQLIQRPNV